MSKHISEALRVAPFQLTMTVSPTMFRVSGDRWPEGTRHYQVVLQTEGKGPGRPVLNIEYSMGSAHTRGPSLEGVMYSVLMDAQAAEDYRDVWEMAAEFGQDINSRETLAIAESAYRACVEANTWLHDVFNRDEIEQLNTLFEDF